MNAGLVKLGGVSAFVLTAVAFAFPVLAMTLEGNRAVEIALQIVMVALTLFVILSTKSLFNRHKYHRADVPILAIMVLSALNLLISLVDGNSLGRLLTPDLQLQGSLSTLAVISIVLSLAVYALWFWFALAAKGFGHIAGSGLWKAIGILYIVSSALLVLAVVAGLLGLVALMTGFLYVAGGALMIGGLVMIACWVCLGIGLIASASRMVTTRTANA